MTTMLTTCAEGPECHVPEAVRGEDPHLEPVVSRGLQRIIAVLAWLVLLLQGNWEEKTPGHYGLVWSYQWPTAFLWYDYYREDQLFVVHLQKVINLNACYRLLNIHLSFLLVCHQVWLTIILSKDVCICFSRDVLIHSVQGSRVFVAGNFTQPHVIVPQIIQVSTHGILYIVALGQGDGHIPVALKYCCWWSKSEKGGLCRSRK